jgi:hypothetical protein
MSRALSANGADLSSTGPLAVLLSNALSLLLQSTGEA